MRGERCERARRRGSDRERRHDEPNQLTRGDEVEEEARPEAADDEGGGTPKPHRAVGALKPAETAQRIGVGERHDRRVEGGRQRQRHGDGNRALCESHHGVAEHGHRGRDQDRCAQRVVPVGAARCQRDREHAHDHGERERNADRAGIEALGREPERQERQLHAERDEERGVEDREPPRK